jgi:hypothetical protein
MNAFQLIYRYIREREETLAQHLTEGSVQTMEQYRQTIGALKELKMLTEEVKDIERRAIDE